MILVTGATGKVGTELVRQLRARGAPFRSAVHSTPAEGGGDSVPFDLDRPETFEPALRGADELFLLSPAGRTDAEGPVVDAARKAGVRHVVKLSVWGADGEAYAVARGHRAIEKRIEASGLAWTFLRPNAFMQNFSTLHVPTIRSQGTFYAYGHGGRMSVIDTRDIAAAAAAALTAGGHEGKAYDLSGPESLTNDEMAEKISGAAGKPVEFADLPDADYEKALMGFGLPPAFASALSELGRHIAAGGLAATSPDVEKVTGSRGIPFDRFAKDHAAAWR